MSWAAQYRYQKNLLVYNNKVFVLDITSPVRSRGREKKINMRRQAVMFQHTADHRGTLGNGLRLFTRPPFGVVWGRKSRCKKWKEPTQLERNKQSRDPAPESSFSHKKKYLRLAQPVTLFPRQRLSLSANDRIRVALITAPRCLWCSFK